MSASVAATIDDIPQAQDAILEELSEAGEYPNPADIIYVVVNRGFSEGAVRSALWHLLDARKLELTLDWVLKQDPNSRNGNH